MMKGTAGSKESSDCIITVTKQDHQEILIDSVVGAFFHDQIKLLIINTLKELKVENVKVEVIDRGALDSTIKARLITAIERMNAL
ncbi:MAG: citrate lyase acyl carrier protein [Firmicutes bacterium]|nr:citrate lyase acyl carrier protein [Bacillota bacterium]